MKKHVAEFIKQCASGNNKLDVIEGSYGEWGLAGTSEDLFDCLASFMEQIIHRDNEFDAEYYNFRVVIDVVRTLKHTKVGDSNVWY